MALNPDVQQTPAAEQIKLISTTVFTLTAPLQAQADGRSFLCFTLEEKGGKTTIWEGPQQQTVLTTIFLRSVIAPFFMFMLTLLFPTDSQPQRQTEGNKATVRPLGERGCSRGRRGGGSCELEAPSSKRCKSHAQFRLISARNPSVYGFHRIWSSLRCSQQLAMMHDGTAVTCTV
jgi:hypothetical protein